MPDRDQDDKDTERDIATVTLEIYDQSEHGQIDVEERWEQRHR